MVFSRFLFPAIALFVAIANCLPLRASVDLVRREQVVLERRVIPITFHANSGVRDEHKAAIEADIRTHMANNMHPNTIHQVGSVMVRQGPRLSLDKADGHVTDSKHVTVDFKGQESHHHITTQHVYPGGVDKATANAHHEALHQQIRDHDFHHRDQTRLANAAKGRMEEEQGHANGHQDQIREARKARATAHKAGKANEVEHHEANIREHAQKKAEHLGNVATHKTAMEDHQRQADHHKAEAARKRAEVDPRTRVKHTWP